MHDVLRDVGAVAWPEPPCLFAHPLLGVARDDVDDLLHRRVAVERVAGATGHAHTHEQQIVSVGQARAA